MCVKYRAVYLENARQPTRTRTHTHSRLLSFLLFQIALFLVFFSFCKFSILTNQTDNIFVLSFNQSQPDSLQSNLKCVCYVMRACGWWMHMGKTYQITNNSNFVSHFKVYHKQSFTWKSCAFFHHIHVNWVIVSLFCLLPPALSRSLLIFCFSAHHFVRCVCVLLLTRWLSRAWLRWRTRSVNSNYAHFSHLHSYKQQQWTQKSKTMSE